MTEQHTASFPTIAAHSCGTVPSLAMVFGERNSGTNLAMELLRLNIPALADSPGDRIGRYGFPYGWKHAFPQMIAAPDTTLAIGLFRHPETWVRSMHARPWHTVPALRDLPFPAFLRAEWETRVDERNFGLTPDDPRWHCELHWDRHPMTGKRFENIVALRNLKNTGFLSLPNRFGNCLLVRHEAVSGNPEGFVRAVSRTYNLPRLRKFKPVATRRGRPSEGAYHAVEYAALEKADLEFLWTELDAGQEKRLGYACSTTGKTHDAQSRQK